MDVRKWYSQALPTTETDDANNTIVAGNEELLRHTHQLHSYLPLGETATPLKPRSIRRR